MFHVLHFIGLNLAWGMTQTHCFRAVRNSWCFHFSRTRLHLYFSDFHAQSHSFFFFFHVFPSTFNWIRLIWLISVVNSVALLLIVIKSIVFADIQVTQKNERKVESEKISLQITLLMNAIQFAIRNSQHSNQSVWPTKIHIEDNESYITGTAPGTVLVQ